MSDAAPAPKAKTKAMIQDNTRCIGCRACMIACKAWNERPADHTDFFAGPGYQNPRDLDANNYTLITFNEITTGARPDWVFGRQLCQHCDHPACASACPTTALRKTELGPVVFNANRCIGCRACMQACPFLIPKYDYESRAPLIHKCTFCADRIEAQLKPACAMVCPTGAISFGDRDDMVAEAKRRIATGARHLHPRDLRARRGGRDERAPPLLRALRADRLHHGAAEGADARPDAPVAARDAARVRPPLRPLRGAHLGRTPPEQEPRARGAARMSVRSRLTAFRLAWLDSPGVRSRLAGFRLTWWDMLLLAVAAAAVVLALIRYATGIASVANINNAYPWGWWVGYGIMTLIAVGGVGFTITLLVEVLGFHRYHPLLRPAVLMAFLCYTSAIVTLMVELGRPWMVWMISCRGPRPPRSTKSAGARSSTSPCSPSSSRRCRRRSSGGAPCCA
jgi:Fe-S-cluster-containing dehydrogenase component